MIQLQKNTVCPGECGNSFNRNNSITSVSSSEYNIGYNELNLKFYG
jgi:hypothetical protein